MRNEIVDCDGRHHHSVRAESDPVVARVEFVALKADGSGLCHGGGLMQSNPPLEAGRGNPRAAHLKIVAVGLDC